MKTKHRWKMMRKWSFLTLGCLLGVLNPLTREPVEATSLGGPSHIGTFDGSTTFTTSSSNGINPGLYLEVMDEYGNYTEYTSEDGVITIPDTQEGAYVTQAKLLGKTKYRDQDTGELLDEWEEGRNLTLESVQMPALTTTGKNLFALPSTNEMTNATIGKYIKLKLKPNTNYTYNVRLDKKGNTNLRDFYGWISSEINDNFNGNSLFHWNMNKGYSKTFNTGDDNWYLHIYGEKDGEDYREYLLDFQIEQGSTATSYEPYKSNILSTSENVVLRGIGEVKDELDLLTGEVVRNIGEVVVDGSENFIYPAPNVYRVLVPDIHSQNDSIFVCDTMPTTSWKNYSDESYDGYVYQTREGFSFIQFKRTEEEFKEFLQKNPITIQYQLAEKSIKTVVLDSTYEFKPVDTREIRVEGSILPLICSVTTPTEPLSFVLNPNAEEGQRFIAPEFTIKNQTPSAVSVELKQFTQVSDVLNDVLPTKYEDWSQLNKKESKDFALALVPLASDGWESLLEGPRYVKDNSNYRLGTIKAESSVNFTFEALHGRAFTEALDPQYRLVLVFDF